MTILTNSNDLVRAATETWQQHMKMAIRQPEVLAERLDLPRTLICDDQATSDFPLFVPLPYLSRIAKGDPNDPLLLQVLPTKHEAESHLDYSIDPVNESQYSMISGLIRKYNGRVLMILNGTCAIHCRYCFRRHFPYHESIVSAERWRPALDHIRSDPTIGEVILSGGDPLTFVDSSLEGLVDELQSIAHLQRLRIHTRLPIVIPQRTTTRLVEMLELSRLTVVVVVHCNHANEIDTDVARSIDLLQQGSPIILNQSVLLRGVNDNLDAQIELSKRLISVGIIPYYLHQLDPVAGAAHFAVDVERGKELIAQMRAKLSGFMVPRYVREIPGEPFKTVLA